MRQPDSASPPQSRPDVPKPGPITEVLVEPGSHQLWVTLGGEQTHRIDLTPLLAVETYRTLRLRTLFARVQVSTNGHHLLWPGGARLDIASSLQAGPLPVRTLAVVPAQQRYRPLRPLPIEPTVVQRLLQLRPGELDQILQRTPAPAEVLFARLYDLGVFLTGHFAPEHLAALMRQPWRYGEQRCPGEPLLHTMLGWLQWGRPDLIERPCMLIATGE
ncbi:DUF2442 domain-containing protein [Deinococcus planocerae]|uniref:DUF2442 domain-containing protein n=1 Tax=Deinococcus planocerae TaxID=1737569 RepID=UPI0015E10607|nr:DUF2442 domain-containing protein [Deinococcus planocerae]